MKKLTATLLLCALLPRCLFAAQPQWSPISSVERVDQLLDELDQNLKQQEELIAKLQLSNSEQSSLISELLTSLKESEESLRRQIALTKNLGNLIEDQAIYQRKSERKTNFWRIISGVLATSLATTLIIMAANK